MPQNSPPEPATHEPSSSRLTTYAVVVVILVLITFVAGLLPRLRQRAAVVVENQDLAVPTVLLVSPSRGTSPPAVRLPAELRALAEAPILARASGYVHKLHVDIGSVVTRGQLMAELETPELNQQLSSARALRDQAVAALQLAKVTADRWAEMRKAKVISPQEADEKNADAELKAAALNSASSEVRRLEELVGFARIVAPFDGVVTARRTDLGQLVSAGAAVELFRLAQTGTLRVFVHLPQYLTPAAVPGTVATVVLGDGTGKRLPARLLRASGAMDPASRTLLVELELPNQDRSVLPGGFAQVEFPDSGASIGWTVPANTLLFRPEGLVVAVVDSQNTVEMRRVILGRDFGATVEVSSGVDASTRLVLNPSDSLSSGAKIRQATGFSGAGK